MPFIARSATVAAVSGVLVSSVRASSSASASSPVKESARFDRKNWGQITVVVMPLSRSSKSTVSASATTAAFVALYVDILMGWTRPATDDVITICAPDSSSGTNARQPRTAPSRLMSSARCHVSMVTFSIAPPTAMPALSTSTSTAPTSAAARSQSSSEVTSSLR